MDEVDEFGPAAVTETAVPGTNQTARRLAASGPASKIEIGGREGPEPTRYGDWELRGRCIDF